MNKKTFTLTSILISFFIIGLLSGVFAAIREDSGYARWHVAPEPLEIEFFTKVALNSVTNSFGGQAGHYSATTWHWGKLHNINYKPHSSPDTTLYVVGGSLWDNSHIVDVDIHVVTRADLAHIAASARRRGATLTKGDPPAELQFYLTNSHNFGELDTHLIRGFTNTSTLEGAPAAQTKATFSYSFD